MENIVFCVVDNEIAMGEKTLFQVHYHRGIRVSVKKHTVNEHSVCLCDT